MEEWELPVSVALGRATTDITETAFPARNRLGSEPWCGRKDLLRDHLGRSWLELGQSYFLAKDVFASRIEGCKQPSKALHIVDVHMHKLADVVEGYISEGQSLSSKDMTIIHRQLADCSQFVRQIKQATYPSPPHSPPHDAHRSGMFSPSPCSSPRGQEPAVPPSPQSEGGDWQDTGSFSIATLELEDVDSPKTTADASPVASPTRPHQVCPAENTPGMPSRRSSSNSRSPRLSIEVAEAFLASAIVIGEQPSQQYSTPCTSPYTAPATPEALRRSDTTRTQPVQWRESPVAGGSPEDMCASPFADATSTPHQWGAAHHSKPRAKSSGGGPQAPLTVADVDRLLNALRGLQAGVHGSQSHEAALVQQFVAVALPILTQPAGSASFRVMNRPKQAAKHGAIDKWVDFVGPQSPDSRDSSQGAHVTFS